MHLACVPAESMRMRFASSASATLWRNTPSAMGERQILPMQQNKTETGLTCSCTASHVALAHRGNRRDLAVGAGCAQGIVDFSHAKGKFL